MASASALVVVILGCLGNIVNCCDYAQYGSNHTMCIYEENACGATNRGVDQKGIDEIVETHNQLRQKVANGQQDGQPSASDMKKLRWNSELAKVAQRWADQCRGNHDSNRKIGKYSSVGQNVYASWNSNPTTAPDFKGIVQSWYNEVTKPGFDPGNMKPFKFDAQTGHYTQVVWATTEEVGCGYAYYLNSNRMYAQEIVCNYGPSGNVIGGEMYKQGQSCSSCNKCASDYPGLCE